MAAVDPFEYSRDWNNVDDFPSISYQKDWNSSDDFPTIETDETQVRQDMQALYDEVKDYINGTAEAPHSDGRWLDKGLRQYVVATGTAEETRIANEATRAANENGRIAAETARTAAEAARAAAETGRASEETARAAAETERASAETSRAAAETARASAETSRAAAETVRESAEAARETAEASRNTAETVRASAEVSRASAETARASAEISRVSSESGRVSAENTRVSAEASRVAAEQARADENTGIVANATAQAQAAAGSAAAASGSANSASGNAVLAESYAKGGTGTRSGEDTDNALYYKGQALTSAGDAAGSAVTAGAKALEAATSATEATAKRNQAVTAAQEAADSATEAESWAVGGTGTRAGEDSNNARYWALQSEQAAGGDYIVRPPLAQNGDFLAFDGAAWVPVSRPGNLAVGSFYIDTPPTRTTYYADESFDPTGMVVKADYYIGGTLVVQGVVITGYSYPTGPLGIGTTSVTISYSEGGVIKTATQALTVNTRVVTVPTLDGTYSYTGGTVTPTFNNYDGDIMTAGGDTTGLDAGSYAAVFALRDEVNMMWADASTSPKSVAWSISKAQLAIPAAKGTYNYTGEEQTLAFDDFDGSVETKGGDYAATNMGSYTATVSINDAANYEWSDGTTVPQSYNWEIEPAIPVYTSPTAYANLVYDGTAQALAAAGNATGGEMQYSLDGSSYSASVPTAAQAGSYTVYYRVIGDENHVDIAAQTISVSIAARTLVVTAKAQSIVYGSSIATGTGQVTASGLATGDALSGVTLTASGTNVTTSGTVTPSAAMVTRSGTAVTSNYDISYAAGNLTITKAAPAYTAPTAKTGLVYTGSAQALINAGSTTGGVMQYSRNGTTFSTTIPSETNANNSYTVYYRIVGDSNHTDVAAQTVTASIAKATLSGITVSISGYTYGGTKSTPSVSGNPGGGTVTYYGRSSATGTATAWSSVTSTTYNAGTRYCYAAIAATPNYNAFTTANASFTIAKATPAKPTLSKSSIALSGSPASTTFTVTRSGDGAITATSSNTGVVTTSVSGATVTVTGVASGSATITVKVSAGTNYNAYTGTDVKCTVVYDSVNPGEYGSDKIAGTKTKGSFVRFDGIDWIVADVSGSNYTLMLKKMTETTTFGSSSTYSGSTIAAKCNTFQNAMSAKALTKVNSKTVRNVTAKVWIAEEASIIAWTDSLNPTTNAWSGIRIWGENDGVYDDTGKYAYWCAEPHPQYTGTVLDIKRVGSFGNAGPDYTQYGFRPCIEVTQ